MRARRERRQRLRALYPPPPGEHPPWGLLDVVDDLWIGNNDGPAVFNDYSLAYIAALFANEAAGYSFPGRIHPREYRGHAVKRDEQPLRRTITRAIERLETGMAIPALRTPTHWPGE